MDKKKRCPKGTRRNKEGVCVSKNESAKKTTRKRCPKGTRRNKEGVCVSKNESAKKTTRKRCPKGTRRNKEGNCVGKTKSSPQKEKMKTPPKSTKYIITIHNSNGTQIKDMDFSIDEPLEFIAKVEKQSGVSDIIPMDDSYIKIYARMMRKPMEDVDEDEQASVWFVDTDKNVKPSYQVNYDDKTYIVKFHNV